MNEILTVSEAAQFLRKHPVTIRNWIEKKKLPAKWLSAGGHGTYAILRNDLLEMMVAEKVRKKITKPKTQPPPQPHLPM